jgi:mRNA interferase MazF
MLLVNFPYTDLTSRKVRPAVVVGRVRGNDVIVAFITSQVTPRPTDTEVLLAPSDPEFVRTGLRAPSLIRLGVIETLHRSLVVGRIGRVGPRTQLAISDCIRRIFEL